jgi:hypothetical protein
VHHAHEDVGPGRDRRVVLRSREDADRRPLFLAAAHRIEATFAITPRERHDAVRVLADCVAVIP